MKIRPQRGSLARSMEAAADIDATAEAIAEYASAELGRRVKPIQVEVEKYGEGIDERIGWNTHIVLVAGEPLGFTDGPLWTEIQMCKGLA